MFILMPDPDVSVYFIVSVEVGSNGISSRPAVVSSNKIPVIKRITPSKLRFHLIYNKLSVTCRRGGVGCISFCFEVFDGAITIGTVVIQRSMTRYNSNR